MPFLEIPDLGFASGRVVTATDLIAINAGARYGVLGIAIPSQRLADWEPRLQRFRVHLIDENARTLGEGQGKVLLDHPMNAALWLVDALRQRGIKLKRGDLLSLGSITAPVPVSKLKRVEARYLDLDPRGMTCVSINFRSP